jgi:glycine betaine/proline transport system ATP-binding protein
MAKIIIENLSKVFGAHPAAALQMLSSGSSKDEIFKETGLPVGLAQVSFEVDEGEILVVMGLSGSGKSTLIRCLNRLIEPSVGRVVVDGVEVTSLDHAELLDLRRKKFGMVFQNFALFPHRTVLSNTEYGLEVQGKDPEFRQEKALEALKLVGLEGWGDAYPSQLSGGMQQRVGLARALAVDPDILLMDEAFSALDPLIRRDMQDELISLQERVQKTIVFITHDLDEALKIGDRIVLMKDARVVQVGAPEDILNNPASRYVEKFVEDVDKSKVLTAGSVMKKVRIVAFPKDGPRTALHKMKEESISGLFVVKRDYTLLGYVGAEAAAQAVENGLGEVTGIMNTKFQSVHPDSPISELFARMAEDGSPVPVTDEDGKLKGVVVRGSLLAGLAEGGLS